MVCPTVRREWFANQRDGMATVYVFSGSCGNGTGVEWDGMELVFISIPVSLSSYDVVTFVDCN